MSVTKSASPRGTTSSISVSQISVMCLVSLPIMRGVNPRFTKLRCLVCCGGSMLSIISRCISICDSSGSDSCTSRRLEEKISGCREMCPMSACLVTAQNPGHAGSPPYACQ
jgi:hypothetical protein